MFETSHCNFFLSRSNACDGYVSKDWSHYGFPIRETNFDSIPLMEYFCPEFLYETFPTESPTPISVQGYYFSIYSSLYYIYCSVLNSGCVFGNNKPLFKTRY